MAETSDKSKKSADDTLATARERFKLAEEAETDFRKEADDDDKFLIGEQWPDDIKQSRALDSRPCLTINRLPQYVKQVTNDQRQNRPSIKVNPRGEGASKETAEVLQGMIRHIEYDSSADASYDTGFEAAARSGLGFFRIITEYADPLSFNQVLKIKRVLNPRSVYLDPFAQEPDGSDANFGFVFEDLSKEEFKRLYPNAKLSHMGDWAMLQTDAPGWIATDSARVAEYFYKEFEETEICQLSSGQVIEKSKLKDLPEGVQVLNERKTQIPKIKWLKLNGIEILEETTWPGSGCYIPIVKIIGDEIVVQGKRVLSGIIRHAKDPQRMYNYWKSAQTETIALAPKAPYVGAAGQFEGFESQWETANTRNHGYLEYNPKTIGGVPAPPPTRNVYEPPVQAITAAALQAADDLKTTTGIYDASLGQRSNEQSGLAIARRTAQAQTTNFHFIDNLSRSLKYAGRVLIDAIPYVYDTASIENIIKEDGTHTQVPINQVFQKDGKDQAHYLDVGKYDVTVSTGPSYQTRRQEAASTMLDFTKSVPQAAPLISDLIARQMDWPGADEIADRLKKTLPPGIADDEKDKQMPIPPQVKAQMDQMGQMIDQLTKHLHSAQDEIDQKKMELMSQERIAFARMETDLKKALITTHSEESIVAFREEVNQITERLKLLGIQSPIGDDQASADPGQVAQPEINQNPTGGQPGQPME